MWPETDEPFVHIELAARRIIEVLHGVEEDEFRSDWKLQAVVERLLEVLGEAARRVPEDARQEHPGIAWAEVVGLRNVIAHAYHRVSLLRIWYICTEDVPALHAYVVGLLADGDISPS